MKKYFSLYSLLLLVQMCFADIPFNNHSYNSNGTNYLPLILGVLFAIGIFAFMHTLKKERKDTK